MNCLKKYRSHVKNLRLSGWLFTAIALMVVIALVSPQQIPVVIYKLSLISLAAVLGYWLDRSLFPDSSPGTLMTEGMPRSCNYEHPSALIDWYIVLAASLIRRAIIVAAVCLSVAMGL